MTPLEFKAAREKLGLTQSELAKLIGVSGARTIGKWENDERPIPRYAQVIMKWAVTGESPFESSS